MPTGPGLGASRALLFDRLVDTDPAAPLGPSGGRTISRAEVQASVAREIGALLNTRIDPTVDTIEPKERTVLEYGLPDFTALAAMSGGDTDRLARAAERAILAFEPRLARPRVEVVTDRTGPHTVSFIITGTLVVDNLPQSYTFPVALGPEDDADAR